MATWPPEKLKVYRIQILVLHFSISGGPTSNPIFQVSDWPPHGYWVYNGRRLIVYIPVRYGRLTTVTLTKFDANFSDTLKIVYNIFCFFLLLTPHSNQVEYYVPGRNKPFHRLPTSAEGSARWWRTGINGRARTPWPWGFRDGSAFPFFFEFLNLFSFIDWQVLGDCRTPSQIHPQPYFRPSEYRPVVS